MSVEKPWGPGLRPTKLMAWAELFTHPDHPPRRPGVYAWFFDELPPGVPAARCVTRGDWTQRKAGRCALGSCLHSPPAARRPHRPRNDPRPPSGGLVVLQSAGAGEGIRTLDVNLGKVALYH